MSQTDMHRNDETGIVSAEGKDEATAMMVRVYQQTRAALRLILTEEREVVRLREKLDVEVLSRVESIGVSNLYAQFMQNKRMVGEVIDALEQENESLSASINVTAYELAEARRMVHVLSQEVVSTRENANKQMALLKTGLKKKEMEGEVLHVQHQELVDRVARLEKDNQALRAEIDECRTRAKSGSNQVDMSCPLTLLWQLTSHSELVEELLLFKDTFFPFVLQVINHSLQSDLTTEASAQLSPVLGTLVNVVASAEGRKEFISSRIEHPTFGRRNSVQSLLGLLTLRSRLDLDTSTKTLVLSVITNLLFDHTAAVLMLRHDVCTVLVNFFVEETDSKLKKDCLTIIHRLLEIRSEKAGYDQELKKALDKLLDVLEFDQLGCDPIVGSLHDEYARLFM